MSTNNPVPELLAISADHNTALFSKKDQAVFIDISSQTVSGMAPLASFSASDKRWTAPDPRTIPTSAYTLAHTLCVESSTGVVAAGELGMKEMSYQVPKLVQASARRGGSWAQQQGIALTHDGDAMRTALTAGGVVPQSLVHHMNDFFSSINTSTEISPGFHAGSPMYPNRDRVEYESWGGDSGREWASKIMAKATASAGSSITLPAALTAAAEKPTNLSGRMTPEEQIEDYEKNNGDLDTGPDSEDFRFLDTRPHDFLNSDDDVYGCKVCGQGAFTLLHIMSAAEPTWDVEDISDELPEPDGSVEPAVLPAEDGEAAGGEEVTAVTASLSRTCYDSFHELESMSGTGENAHVVGDLDNDTSSVRYYFEPSDDRDGLVSLYVTDDEGKTWRVWSPLRMVWDPSGIPPHTILPIDRPSAYRAATVISSPTSREEYVHPSHINAAEWDVVDADLPDVVVEIDPLDTDREPEFFFDSINGSVFLGLVGGDDSVWMWDEDSLSWDVMPGRSLSPNAVYTNSTDASEYLRTVLDSDVLTAEALERAQVITALDDDIVDDDDLDDDNDDDDLFSVVAATADQDYTPEERSKNATQQVRDKMGRFARAQSTVRVGEYTGKITKIDAATQSVVVQFDNGKSATVPAKSVEVIKAAPPVAGGYQPLSEVPGSPDGPSTTTKARFAEPRTPLTSKELKSAIDGYEEFIRRSRAEKAQALQITPQNSDVKPLYMAVVDPIDRTAVIDLVALVPESEESSKPTAFIRTNKGWEPSEKIMRQLKSTTPPPVVVLNDNDYNAVLAQVDQFWTENPSKEEENKKDPISAAAGAGAALWDEYGMLIPLTAAGGLDRNRGGAEHLRRYWTKGPGALKIKWGLPGDWSRCVRQLSKYLGVRSKGYCQLRHKEVLGMYTGTHAKMHRKGLSAAALLPEVDTRPTKGMADACDRALSWVSDGKAGSGFEKATAQRAKKIASRQQLTPAHIKRMHNFFSRHAVDKKAKGWNPGDASYPSPGRVAWDAWGGDAGQQWAAKKVAQFSELSAVQFENLAAEGVVELFTVPARLLHHDAAVVAAASRTTEVTIATRTPYLVEAAALDEFSADRDLIPGEEFLVKDGNSLLHAEVLDTRDFLGWEGSEALLFLSEDDTIMLDREPEGS